MDQRSTTRKRNAEQETERTCKACDETKPIAEFNVSQGREGYRRHECKSCESLRKKSWYRTNYDEARARKNAAAKAHHHRKCKLDPERRKKLAKYANVCRAKAKHEAFMRYGGYKCACCGETELKFLTLDHVNNDGYMRKKYGKEPRGAAQLYGWLRKMGYPDGFQILCMNCNFGKARNGGICPHKKGSTTIPKGSTAKRREVPRSRSQVG
jgi:hypothetical protein